ncbi:unnamed protein product, partial [Pleuronectes platessa]
FARRGCERSCWQRVSPCSPSSERRVSCDRVLSCRWKNVLFQQSQLAATRDVRRACGHTAAGRGASLVVCMYVHVQGLNSQKQTARALEVLRCGITVSAADSHSGPYSTEKVSRPSHVRHRVLM